MKKVVRLTESDLIKLVKRVIKESETNEGLWDNIFGKAGVDAAAKSHKKRYGYSSTGRDDQNYGEKPSKEDYYTVFNGQKFYEDDIEYADPYDTGDIPRVEDGKLIIANPAWSL